MKLPNFSPWFSGFETATADGILAVLCSVVVVTMVAWAVMV